MGFLDDMQSTLQRGADSASRSLEISSINGQIKDAEKRRLSFAAQLGASLYEATKDDEKLREGREDMYDQIAGIDSEIDGYRDRIAQIEREEEEAKAAAEASAAAQAAAEAAAQSAPAVAPSSEGVECPFCHNVMAGTDKFCAGCGKPMAEVREYYAAQSTAEPAAAPACPSCGAAVSEGDKFCMNCGTKLA